MPQIVFTRTDKLKDRILSLFRSLDCYDPGTPERLAIVAQLEDTRSEAGPEWPGIYDIVAMEVEIYDSARYRRRGGKRCLCCEQKLSPEEIHDLGGKCLACVCAIDPDK